MPDRAAGHHVPELLCPAGDEDSLRAAVANGADAVYFGLDDFNARRRASNFTPERLPELVRWLHRRNVRAYVAFNTLVFSGELERARRYVAAIAEAGADAVIVQDLGLIRLVRAMCPSLAIHASTQTTQTHAEGIGLLKSLGVSRVILARELSLLEIEAIARATDVELEVFVHGAICISFSGQCLASHVLWGRSANRGLCAQACRLPYELSVDGQIRDSGGRRYPLSPRDLAAAGLLDRLAALGVSGLKIEGRLKSPAYVASATRVYREVLDKVLRGRSSVLTREQELELTLSFSRGFTTGFLEGRQPAKLVDGQFPRSRGLLVGHVDGRTRRGVIVRLMSRQGSGGLPLSPGDGVVFDEGRPDAPEQGGRVYEVRERPGRPGSIEITFGRDDLDVRSVAVGARVWKTDDPALRRRLERSARRADTIRRTPLLARVEAAPGQTLRLCLRSEPQKRAVARRIDEVTVESPGLLERAVRHPLTVDLLREQLSRLGDTPYELGGIELMGPDGPAGSVPVMVPKSLLNEMRRRAVESLLNARDAAAAHEVVRPAALEEIREGLLPTCGAARERPLWSLLVRTDEQLRASLDWLGAVGAARASGPSGGFPRLIYVDAAPASATPTVQAVRDAGCLAGLATPQIVLPGEERLLDHIIDTSPDAVLVRSLAALAYLRKHAPAIVLIGDHSLNAANEITVATLAEAGLARITPAYDLNAAQLSAMRSRAPGIELELIAHSHVPLFHTAHCIVSAELANGQDCARCSNPRAAAGGNARTEPRSNTGGSSGRRGIGAPIGVHPRTPAGRARPCERGDIRLRDRNGHLHPLTIDQAGRTTIFSEAVRSVLSSWREVQALRPGWLRVELLRESAEQTRALLDRYADALSGEAARHRAGFNLTSSTSPDTPGASCSGPAG